MSCPKTRHLLVEYFDESVSGVAREEIERHLSDCDACAKELQGMLAVQAQLSGWQAQRTPHWDRSIPHVRERSPQTAAAGRIGLWQWLPTAACAAMLAALLFNVSVTGDSTGFSVSFGGQSRIDSQEFDLRLAQFAEQQRRRQEESLQQLLAGLDAQQDSNNLQLIQAVMEQVQQFTAESIDQMYSHFEQQRQLDLENVQFSYQQLLDSDFETLRTMEQLASYVQYQAEIR